VQVHGYSFNVPLHDLIPFPQRDGQLYKNTDGIITTIQNHLKTIHAKEYKRISAKLGLKHFSDAICTHSVLPMLSGPFDLQVWIQLLI
jgi:hypothetical protein